MPFAVLLVVLAAFLFGSASPLSKSILSSVTPFQLAGLLYLGAALGVAPGAILPHFNLGKIFFKETRLEEGRLEHSRAKEIDPTAFAALQQSSSTNEPDRFVVRETLSAEDLRKRIFAASPETLDLRNRLLADRTCWSE